METWKKWAIGVGVAVILGALAVGIYFGVTRSTSTLTPTATGTVAFQERGGTTTTVTTLLPTTLVPMTTSISPILPSSTTTTLRPVIKNSTTTKTTTTRRTTKTTTTKKPAPPPPVPQPTSKPEPNPNPNPNPPNPGGGGGGGGGDWTSGMSSWFNPCDPGQNHGWSCVGACDNPMDDNTVGVAVNAAQYRPEWCGKQMLEVQDVQKGTTLRLPVMDRCAACAAGGLDLTPAVVRLFGRTPCQDWSNPTCGADAAFPIRWRPV